jgi:flagellar basal-body rod modification protein FlgD
MAFSGVGSVGSQHNRQIVLNPDPLNPVVKSAEDPASADNFMRLMIEQLRNQDPLSPMQSNEFTQQIATLNSLEQLVSINRNISDQNRSAGLAQATGLIGKYVEGLDAQQRPVLGTVEQVDMVEGLPVLKVGDKVLLLQQVVAVSAGKGGS